MVNSMMPSRKTDEHYMRLAIAQAAEGVHSGQSPFGACIVRDGTVVSCAHNTVLRHTDSTEHAEINAIRAACRALQTIDLSGGTIYTTCEPCPMCFTACHWARLDRIVYGAAIADVQAVGFNELTIPAETMKRAGGSPIKLTGGVLREENVALIQAWAMREDRQAY